MRTQDRELRPRLADAAKMAACGALVALLAWGASEGAGRVTARVNPRSERAYSYFRADYSRAEDKSAFLLSYRLQLCEHGGCYTPALVDGFLCQRLKDAAPQAEGEAIVDFYAEQAGGREGTRITSLPSPVRERALGLLMGRVESYEPQRAEQAFVLAEQLRTGKELFKASVGLSKGAYKLGWQAWWESDGLPRTRRAFRSWWRRGEPWSAKSKRDPLAGSGLEVLGL